MAGGDQPGTGRARILTEGLADFVGQRGGALAVSWQAILSG